MNLKDASVNVLDQLKKVLIQLSDEDYCRSIPFLEATIGQHVRHILEFYICLFQGLETGSINYDHRRRDKRIESNIQYALGQLDALKSKIEDQTDNPDLLLNLKYGEISNKDIVLGTSYNRELAYNIEHTIHHMAIIKQAFREIGNYVELPENFGIASSTIRFINRG